MTFRAQALESRYAFLDDCPPGFVSKVVTLPFGTLEQRVAGTRAWRDALLSGQLPARSSWPGAPVDVPVREALTSMGLARFCKDEPELVDALLHEILDAFGRANTKFQSQVAQKLRELEELERIELERASKDRKEARLDEATLARLRSAAEGAAAASLDAPDAALLEQWGARARAWAQIADVFGDLGQMLGRGWDLSQGVLKQTGWLDLLRLQELISKLPELREIVQTLGRLHDSDEGESVAHRLFETVRRLEEERQEVRTPLVPAEMRGVRRSGEISRMLPAEAVMLGHPKLRLVWHARRAERALLTYRVEGSEIEVQWTERDVQVEVEREQPRPVRGPIIVVVDTSGSMHGVPERVAKAIVLEAARTAHVENRQCYTFAYSGPGQVLEQELDLSPDGLTRLLTFLGLSFGGGTDIGALHRAVELLDNEVWSKADVVLVTDGEWRAGTQLVQRVEAAREAGTRFHGVQIGNRGVTGLHAICDPVHEFKSWAQAAGWRSE